jgi:RND family efflux transporter MFP subunit
MTLEKNIPAKSALRWLAWLRPAAQWLLMLVGLVGVTLLLLVLAGYFHEKVEPSSVMERTRLPAEARLVEVAEVKQLRYESAVGAIKPVHEANVASKILARVIEVNATAGMQVREGDVLVRLSDEEQQSRVRQAEADRDSMVALLQLARTEAARAEQLIASKAISQAEYDTAKASMQTAAANAERASRAVEEAKVFLDYATVLAPFSGTIVDKAVAPGDTVIPGQALVTLYEPGNMQLVANVRESLAMRLTVGQQIPASLEALGYQCLATVSELVPKADISSRSFEVKATAPCPSGTYSGMFGRLMIPLEEERLLLIPRQAIQRVGQLTMVMVVRDGQVTRRTVQLGRLQGDQVEVLSGLQAGEQLWLPSTEEGSRS